MASQPVEQQVLVDAANVTLRTFLRDPEMAFLRDRIESARAVLIVPQGVRFGAANAVLLAKPGRWWNGPSVHAIAVEGVGASAGVNTRDVVAVVITASGLRSVLDASTAGGEVRVAAAGSGTSADVIAYVRGDPAEDGVRYDRVRIAAPDACSDTLVARSDLVTRSAVQRAHAGSLPAKLDRTIRRP